MVQVMPIQPKAHKMKSNIQKLGITTEAMMMITYKLGTEDQISMRRWKMRSKGPPK